MRVEQDFDGPNAVANFTAERIAAMTVADTEDSGSPSDTVVATVHLSEYESGATTFVISSSDGRNVGWQFSRYSASSSEMPPREFAYNEHGRERLPLNSILTRATLRMGVTIEIAQRMYVVIGWKDALMGGWLVIELDLAPALANG